MSASRHSVPLRVAKTVIGSRRSIRDDDANIPSFGWGPPMTTRSDHHSDYGPSQLVLFGMAVFVLLVFTWTYVH